MATHAERESSPDVTVIVPAFRHERYIEDCLRSVLAQSYGRFRIVVIDDASPDDTAKRAALIGDRRIAVELNHSNRGLAATVLSALESVDTAYVSILNSDDLYHPDRLRLCRQILEDRPDAQVVATAVAPIDEWGHLVGPKDVSRMLDGDAIVRWMRWFTAAGALWFHDDLRLALLETNFLVTSSNIFCRTDFLRQRQDALSGLRYCLDWQVFVEAAATRGLVLVPDPLLAYRLHNANTIWMPDPSRRAEFRAEVNRVLANGLRHLSESLRDLPDEQRVARLDLALTHHVARQPDADANAILLSLLDSR